MTRELSVGRVKEDLGKMLRVEASNGETFQLPKGRAIAAACFSCAYFDSVRNHCYRLDLPFTKGGHKSECNKHKAELDANDPYLPDIWEEEDQEFDQLFELPGADSEHSDPEKVQTMLIEDIETSGGTQQRVKLDLAHVARLKQEIEEGATLAPVVVFADGATGNFWLADGFHRIQAVRELAAESGDEGEILAIIKPGTLRDAILYSVGANDHPVALPRSRADKRKAVATLLSDPEWSQWSDRAIAAACKLSHPTVAKLRREIEAAKAEAPATRLAERKGTVYPITLPTPIKKPSPEREGNKQATNLDDPEHSDPSIASAPPSPVKINLDENLLGVLSNLSYYPLDKLEAAINLIQAEINDRRKRAA